MNIEQIIYSTSVFSFKTRINTKNLTKEGYFDLTKLDGLRIFNNGFLENLRKKYNKSRVDIAKMLNIPVRTLIGWESNNKSFPFEKLNLLVQILKLDEKSLYEIIKGAEFTYGLHHGKNKIILPLIPEDFVLANYITLIKSDKVYLVKDTPEKIKKEVLNHFSIDKTLFRKNGLIIIYSYLLNRFLKTFYVYEKKIDLNFPLSKDVQEMVKNKIDLKKAVIIPMSLSDGGEKPNRRLFFSGASTSLHNVWADAFYYEYNLLPSSYILPYKSIYITTHIIPKEILIEIKNLCPNFKTSPIKQTREDYLKLPQPSIKYLFSSKKSEQEIAIRLWASTEGSIGINLDKRKRLIYPIFKIACAHPSLILELQQLARLNGINFHVKKEIKNWSGLSALVTFSLGSSLNFLKMGGFFDVAIAESRSTYFGGLKKQDVFLSILEFMNRQRIDKNLRTTNKLEAYQNISKIARNGDFKDINHYLNVFKMKS